MHISVSTAVSLALIVYGIVFMCASLDERERWPFGFGAFIMIGGLILFVVTTLK